MDFRLRGDDGRGDCAGAQNAVAPHDGAADVQKPPDESGLDAIPSAGQCLVVLYNERFAASVENRKDMRRGARAGILEGRGMHSQSEFVYERQNLLDWRPAHSASLRLAASGAVFADAPGKDWHLVRLTKPELLFTRMKIRLIVKPMTAEGACVYLHHYGRGDIAKIAMDGRVAFKDADCILTVGHDGDSLVIEAEFDNHHPTLSLGSATKDAVYEGTGKDLFEIRRIEVSILGELNWIDRGWPVEDRLRIIDVGSAGGLQAKWLKHPGCISPILFEPNPEEAEKLKTLTSKFPGGAVIEKALSNLRGSKALNIAAFWGCSSLLEPNFDVLSRYKIGNIFKIKKQVKIECVRYDELYRQGAVPIPDVIKIDVQGYEYEALLGFGGLLQNCLGIELEAHVYPIYRNQKLLHDIIAMLDDHGLVLRAVRPVDHFDGDVVEVDAFFTRRRPLVDASDERTARKLKLIESVWRLG